MKILYLLGILFPFFLTVSLAQDGVPSESELYPRPTIIPRPEATTGVQKTIISLDGTWKFNAEPPAEYWSNSVDFSSWTNVLVPAHIATQGFSVREVQQYAYKLKFQVPADYSGKRIFIKLNGVTGMAKAWINGTLLKEHFGGFTTWDCDITDFVTPGQEAVLTVGIDDTRRGLSGYNNGGILRDVQLIAVPQDHIKRLNIETDLDEAYDNAVLKLWIGMDFNEGNTARIDFSLTDASGKAVSLNPNNLVLTKENAEKIIEIPVSSPMKWDAEHPNLYKLTATVIQDNKPTQTVSKNVGFREVKRVGKELLVNGKPVKLRGIDRKDIYPLTGRSVPLEYREMDARLFKECNMNYIRTSHYPTHEEFLDACDKYGIYVESENSVSFANGEVPNNPDLTIHYLSQLAEMMERDRSHPSIIIWSIGNESAWGENVAKESEYVRHEDPSRIVKFSWSHLIPLEDQPKYIDLFSFHYPYWERDMDAGGPLPGKSQETSRQSGTRETDHTEFPVLHDEYAHTPVYRTVDLKRDPGIHNFWGESIKRLWETIFVTHGALGGGIWAAVDNSSIVPEEGLGVSSNDWGLVDGWRRKKPEYWLTKKAYSTVRVEFREYANPGAGKPMNIPVKNWFDQSNLNEITITWSVGTESGQINGPDVEPNSQGSFQIPARQWKDGDIVNLKFFTSEDVLIDEFNLPINPPARPGLPEPQGPAPRINSNNNSITVSGEDFELIFSRSTGLITNGTYKGDKIIESGPYFNLIGQELGDWNLTSINAEVEGTEAVVNITGSYDIVDVGFNVRIAGNGLITTQYTLLSELPPLTRRLVAEGYNRDVGGYWELGVSYIVSSEVDRLTWERKALWSAYPDDHIGRNKGTAYREGEGHDQQYGEIPSWPWSEDEKNFTLFGRNDPAERGTRDFRATKENFYNASALLSGSEKGIMALSDGSDYTRLEVVPAKENIIDGTDLRIRYSGNWTSSEGQKQSTSAGSTIEFTFDGTGIIWSGSRNQNGGTVDIFIDDELESNDFSLTARSRFGSRNRNAENAEQQPQPPV
ncbi:MAG TPA: glycoside hydrolase family 2 TIM barrel-domain containing protein, partial [Draconibacterium sp.]|nr:glycoside hydrolase family 2 TIM barrel-domain containing protein [Draconibacterium sp.]